jgi:hypothetical protein
MGSIGSTDSASSTGSIGSLTLSMRVDELDENQIACLQQVQKILLSQQSSPDTSMPLPAIVLRAEEQRAIATAA